VRKPNQVLNQRETFEKLGQLGFETLSDQARSPNLTSASALPLMIGKTK
jgi:hypothetical protein